jgi:DNA-binding MarR family transcriptional regulator
MTENSAALDQDAAALEALILHLGWATRRHLDQELACYNLTLPQFMALRCIQAHRSGCSMGALAESAHQMAATMTGIVDRLVEGGLVSRARDPQDRRSLQVVLTPAGEALLERISAAKHAWIRQFLSAIPAPERQQMLALGARYLAMIEQTIPTP